MNLVTGASGYLGRALYADLKNRGEPVVSAGRSSAERYLDLEENADWSSLLYDVTTVIHCAGIAHSRAEHHEYESVNVEGAKRLGGAALRAGVRRFIYISSLNVVPRGAANPHAPASDWPVPDNTYARSKRSAEMALTGLFQGSDCELIILRPALVYDMELTGNLATLQRLGRWNPIALPATGRRSMVSRPDLVAIIARGLMNEPGPGGKVSQSAVADGEHYSAERIGRALAGRVQLQLPGWCWRLILGVWGLLPLAYARGFRRALAGELWISPDGQPQGGVVNWRLESLLSHFRADGVDQ